MACGDPAARSIGPGAPSGRNSVVWTLLVLGILFGVLVLALAARHSRQRFRDSEAAFRCRLRIRGHRSAIWPSLGRHWSRPMWALWDDDVLVVRRGPVLARTIPLRAQLPVGGVHHLL